MIIEHLTYINSALICIVAVLVIGEALVLSRLVGLKEAERVESARSRQHQNEMLESLIGGLDRVLTWMEKNAAQTQQLNAVQRRTSRAMRQAMIRAGIPFNDVDHEDADEVVK